jgi:hypothetical protein
LFANTRAESDRLERGHHGHVFVFEVVAVDEVAAGIVGEADGDLDVFGGREIDGVFPAGVGGGGRVAAAGNDLELVEVNVNRVVQVGDEPPDLGVAEPDRGVDPVGSNGFPLTSQPL